MVKIHLFCLAYFSLYVNSLIPKSDWHLISPYHITIESNIKVMRIKELMPMKKALDCKTNSPCQNLRKCLENSRES